MSDQDGQQRRPVYLLRLQSLPGLAVPEAIRLRSALKLLRRAFGFRCVEVRELPDGTPPDSPKPLRPADPGATMPP